MKAVCWHGTHDVRVENVPEPKILNHRDALVKITLTAICGSDLHLYDGYIPTMQKGDILGHEFMGEVLEVGTRSPQPEEGRPRRGAVHDLLRTLLLLPKGPVVAVRQHQSERVAWRRKCTAKARPGCSATRTCSADSPAGRRSTCACRSPTSGRSRFPRACATTRCSSSPTSSRPATWRRRTATSSPATRSRSGAAAGRAVRDPQRVHARARSG